MADKHVKIEFKIYLEAEDVAQTRILSSTSFVKNVFENCGNSYMKDVELDNENDLDDFVLRLFIDKEITEEKCSDCKSAEAFVGDMAEFLDLIAQTQPYMEMEGSFGIAYQAQKTSYTFCSGENQDFCEFEEKNV